MAARSHNGARGALVGPPGSCGVAGLAGGDTGSAPLLLRVAANGPGKSSCGGDGFPAPHIASVLYAASPASGLHFPVDHADLSGTIPARTHRRLMGSPRRVPPLGKHAWQFCARFHSAGAL